MCYGICMEKYARHEILMLHIEAHPPLCVCVCVSVCVCVYMSVCMCESLLMLYILS